MAYTKLHTTWHNKESGILDSPEDANAWMHVEDGIYNAAAVADNALASAIPKSLVTAAGDMITASGASAPTRLGVGTNGQVLTVVTGAPAWATAGGGAPSGPAGGDLAGSYPNPTVPGKAPLLIPTTIKTAAYTAASGDLVRGDATSGTVPIALPVGAPGLVLAIKKMDSSVNTVTFTANGSDLIDGVASGTLRLLNETRTLIGMTGGWTVGSGLNTLTSLDARYAPIDVAPVAVTVAAPTGVQSTDEANIATAVAAAGVGGRVLFRAGTYVAQSLTPLSGQTWIGNGTTITRPSSASSSVITGTGLADFELRGFILDGARATSTATSNAVVLLINSLRPRIIDNTFQNTPTLNAGLILQGASSGLVSRNRFKNVGYGALVGLNLGDTYLCRDNVVSHNVLDTSDWNAFFFTENLGSNGANTTIAAASNGQVLPQATITVASTTGFPTSGQLRIGGYGGPVVAYTGTTGTTFTGCTTVSASGTLATGQAVQIAVQGLVQGSVFTGNTVRAYGDCGVESGSGCVGTVISGNSFYGSALSNQSILFRDCRDSSATGNTCANNTKTNAGTGIYLLNKNGTSEHITLTGNMCIDNAYVGILAESTRDVTICGGLVARSGRVGIRLRTHVGYTITGVDVLSNGETGVELGQFGANSATDGIVTGCRIMDNNTTAVANDSGISLFQSSTVTIVGNRIGDRQTTPTQAWGIRIYDSTVTADIRDNDLHGNISGGLQNFGSSTLLRVSRNRGYNPQGVQSVTPGTSPWTYTAGITPETVYPSGGTSVSYTKDGFGISGPFSLEPGESIVVTYTGVPTVRVDRK